jgi:hypothetical protein
MVSSGASLEMIGIGSAHPDRHYPALSPPDRRLLRAALDVVGVKLEPRLEVVGPEPT